MSGQPNAPENDDLVDFDDELVFEDEESGSEAKGEGDDLPPWRVLMIDDDEQVHQSTLLAVGDEIVLGRKLQFIHAKTGSEAIAMIDSGMAAPDLAFVDMVMESPDAGLRFARAAKNHANWRSMMILLRSGQPGFSNEMEQARQLGVEGFVQKANVSRAVLLQALVDLLSGGNYFMS